MFERQHIVKGNFGSFQEAIKYAGEQLTKNGYVSEDFTLAVLKREETYPTALPTSSMNVAIPHTEAEYVKKATVFVIILEDTVKMNSMIDPDSKLDVSVMFLLAINNPDGQLETLKKIMKIIQDDSFMLQLYSEENEEQIFEMLNSKIEKE